MTFARQGGVAHATLSEIGRGRRLRHWLFVIGGHR